MSTVVSPTESGEESEVKHLLVATTKSSLQFYYISTYQDRDTTLKFILDILEGSTIACFHATAQPRLSDTVPSELSFHQWHDLVGWFKLIGFILDLYPLSPHPGHKWPTMKNTLVQLQRFRPFHFAKQSGSGFAKWDSHERATFIRSNAKVTGQCNFRSQLPTRSFLQLGHIITIALRLLVILHWLYVMLHS